MSHRRLTLDQGIIKSFKCLYKKKLNAKINLELDSNQNLNYNDLLKQIKFFDAFMLILEAWRSVTKEVIINCYSKAIQNENLNDQRMLDLEEIKPDSCEPSVIRLIKMKKNSSK
ncbi:hypothetical protein DMUE_5810 [Dictyocoela muelleri]|nr:hypothetical protein DMUE_5810 [Dictyocoela muelleri]